jgi:hypothetical protein
MDSLILIEQEKIQKNFPLWSFKTPPILEGLGLPFGDASISHFKYTLSRRNP